MSVSLPPRKPARLSRTPEFSEPDAAQIPSRIQRYPLPIEQGLSINYFIKSCRIIELHIILMFLYREFLISSEVLNRFSDVITECIQMKLKIL